SDWVSVLQNASETGGGGRRFEAAATPFSHRLKRFKGPHQFLVARPWDKKESVPACANSSTKRSGFEIIRCASSGRRIAFRSDRMIGAPIEILGTKCPSITSTWIRSAPARSASAT